MRFGLKPAASAVVQPRAGLQPSADPDYERLARIDALGSESRSKLPPTLLREDADMAHIFATAVCLARAKRHAQVELLARTPNIFNAKRVILIGLFSGSYVPAEQVDPRLTYAGGKGRMIVHERRRWLRVLGGQDWFRDSRVRWDELRREADSLIFCFGSRPADGVQP